MAVGEPMRFWKMSGAGNDFVVLPHSPESLAGDPAEFVRRVCRRGLSVGADGVLFVAPGAGPGAKAGAGSAAVAGRAPSAAAAQEADAVLVHYNSDGGRSDFCGNGSRCAARFAVLMGFAPATLRLQTDVGLLRAEVDPARDRVRIEAPAPSRPERRRCEAGGQSHEGWFVLAGVPHFVLQVPSPDGVDVASLGAALRSHPAMGPAGANVDFLGPVSEGRRRMRTFERGVEAETLACGSGALAAAAVLAAEGAPSPVVLLPGSGIELVVDFEPGDALARGSDRLAAGAGPRSFHLAGEARVVFEGILSPGPERSDPAP